MKLLIHDLDPDRRDEIEAGYAGWKKMARANGLKPEDLFRRIE